MHSAPSTQHSALKGVFVTATDTGVGKTFVSALLIRALRKKGVDAGYFKPVATGGIREQGIGDGEVGESASRRVSESRSLGVLESRSLGVRKTRELSNSGTHELMSARYERRATRDGIISEDVLFVERLTGLGFDRHFVNPVCYQAPVSPMTAARLEGKSVPLNPIWTALAMLRRRHEFLVVEGVGGAAVPLRENYLISDLAKAVGFPAVVVARRGLGTLNHTMLTLEHLETKGIPVAGVILVQSSPEADLSVRTNARDIARLGRIPVLGVLPWSKCLDGAALDRLEARLDIGRLFGSR
ncbi:MAG: dethiobiotin synthase [Planctomycetota bacterium]